MPLGDPVADAGESLSDRGISGRVTGRTERREQRHAGLEHAAERQTPACGRKRLADRADTWQRQQGAGDRRLTLGPLVPASERRDRGESAEREQQGMIGDERGGSE